jgi:hypothetical protein
VRYIDRTYRDFIMTRTATLAVVLAATLSVSGEPLPRQAWGERLVQLPNHVVAPEEKLTFFADFDNDTAKGIPVYVVNRTGKPITFRNQDGDLFLKQEYESAPGVWTRSQSHTYSWCGNSYMMPLTLESGRFVVVWGFCPKDGDKKPVRYRFYNGVHETATNVGSVRVAMAEVEKAANDSMATQFGSFEFVRDLAIGKTTTDAKRRMEAFHQLTTKRFDRKQTVPILELLANDKDESLAKDARGMLEYWRKNPKD